MRIPMPDMTKEKIAFWAMPAVVSVLTAIIAWQSIRMIGMIDDLDARMQAQEKRAAAVDASRFTATDGKEVWREIAAIREQIAKMPNELPPKWFVQRVDSLDTQLQRNGDTLKDIEKRLMKIEAKNGGTP
jgi:lipopolysaccharide biosynthesis protein